MSAGWSNSNVDFVISLTEKVRYKNMKKRDIADRDYL